MIGAGLIPRLRADAVPGSEQWVIAQMVPGASPLTEVEAVVTAAAGVPNGLLKLLDPDGEASQSTTSLRVMPTDGRVLVVIDQFEELFTITDEQPRRRFLSAIASAVAEPGSQITVLLALRADYYDRPLLHPEFAQVFTPGVVNALPMTANELEAVIVGPAERAGVAVEPRLVGGAGRRCRRPAGYPTAARIRPHRALRPADEGVVDAGRLSRARRDQGRALAKRGGALWCAWKMTSGGWRCRSSCGWSS